MNINNEDVRNSYILQSLLSLNLNNCEQRIVRLLQILRRRLPTERSHRKGRPEPAAALRRKLGRSDQPAGVVGGTQKRHDDAMRAGIKGSWPSRRRVKCVRLGLTHETQGKGGWETDA